MKYKNVAEEELKNKVWQDYFYLYDCSKILGGIDFCVSLANEGDKTKEMESLIWAEAKKNVVDVYSSITQLILTIGKARTFDKVLPPPYLGAFDPEKIAFVPYANIVDFFYKNDFNWNVAPSNHSTREFAMVLDEVKSIIDKNVLIFHFQRDDKELRNFISNLKYIKNYGSNRTPIDKNNFMVIYAKWLKDVKPTIRLNWELANKKGIIDGDFYLADLLSAENHTLKEKLYVLLQDDRYVLDRKITDLGVFQSSEVSFTDGQKAHTIFWNTYQRPPKEEYWDFIIERRDLLVPQDVRERKGSFFTPQIWVELSQKYLADTFGEDWQEEYYIWDCAAGTGNLLAGLTNKYNIWASTLDRQDVDVMHDRIANGANLLDSHVFQFDFLNDDFSKLPQPLQDIINDPEKRKKLIIYINPPYAEAGTKGTKDNKTEVSKTMIGERYKDLLSKASNELFAQFFIRVYKEIPGAALAEFSK